MKAVLKKLIVSILSVAMLVTFIPFTGSPTGMNMGIQDVMAAEVLLQKNLLPMKN